jgi:DNA repair ATPase RecN
MSTDEKNINNGWAEYGNSILEKLKELHQCNKETRQALDELKFAVEKLKINGEEVKALREWKKEVCEVWSASNMEEAQKEIYSQKSKWSVIYGVIIALQVVWAAVIAYLNMDK